MVGLTKPLIDQITASGASDATEIVVENERLIVTAPSESDVSEVQVGHYDPIQGVLTITLYNGEQIKVGGFPTQNNIPAGPTGPQGLPGKDGKAGKAGKDGVEGPTGCEGPPGPTGPSGKDGREGRKGRQGPIGNSGPTGPRGPIGPKGPPGDIGFIGPTGPRGEQGPTGAVGEQGPPGTVNVIVSNTDPGEQPPGTIWVNPVAVPPVVTPSQPDNTAPPPVTDPDGGNVVDPGTGLIDPPVGTPWP